MLEWTITLGNLLNFCGLMAGAATIYVAMKSDLVGLAKDVKFLSEKQAVLNEAFSQIGKILTTVAVQDSRLVILEKQIDEIKHGTGYIKRASQRES